MIYIMIILLSLLAIGSALYLDNMKSNDESDEISKILEEDENE